MIPFFLPPMMKACPEEESYILPDYLFCQPISYCTVSLTLFFFWLCPIDHTSHHMTDCCVLVCLLFLLEELVKLPNISPVVLPCLPLLQCLEHFFFGLPSTVDSASPRALLILSPPLRWFASQRTIKILCYTTWTHQYYFISLARIDFYSNRFI